jgi:hypothetical protein
VSRYSDLELALRRRDASSYAASLRFNGPDDAAEQRSPVDPVFTIDNAALADTFDALGYGTKLGEAFFTGDLKTEFLRFRGLAQNQSSALRVRLSIESSAPELHALHWETLRDPAMTETPLFMGDATIVSRFLASGIDSRPVRLKPKADLSALVVVANPQNLDDFDLAPVKVAIELENVRLALESGGTGIRITELAPGGAISLQSIEDELGKGEGYDIVYLVCHGALIKGEPNIFLDDAGPVPGVELVKRIWELDTRPRLVVLASCESAGKGGVGLAALGPRLADAGVPAVIAMQGEIGMKTSAAFMKEFFTQLMADGQIDRAMSVARGAVRGQPDCWMPALFMRLRNGRIWYVPGFEGTGEKDDFQQWSSICKFVHSGQCVPILGPDVAEHINGSSRAVAMHVAREQSFPMDTRDQFDLAKVSQYLAIQQSPKFARSAIRAAFQDEMYKAGKRILGKDVSAMGVLDLQQALAIHAATLDDEPLKRDPLRIVAGFDVPLFVNAAYDTLLESYVREADSSGKKKVPVPLASEWRDARTRDASKQVFPGEATVEKPYVYYVFGKRREAEESTWVLTEDDFFDYLIRTSQYKLMPGTVSEALVAGSLIFLGFPLDDWKFRVLFRMIIAKDGSELLKQFNHVAVQVDPAETTLANARLAKTYLQKYFTNSKIDIYWGTAGDFLRQLRIQLDKMPTTVDRSE